MKWIIAILFAVISIIFLCGRGSCLIAGYNTASKEERDRYDEKKLCRVMGRGCMVITAALVINAAFGESLPPIVQGIVPVVTITVCLCCILLASTVCRKEELLESISPAERTRERRIVRVAIVFCMLLAILVLCVMMMGKVDISIAGQELRIEATVVTGKSLTPEEIENVTYVERLDVGKRVAGIGNARIEAGIFRNGEFDDYRLYSYTNCDAYIVLQTGEGVVVVNGRTEEETRELYKEVEVWIHE